MARERSVLGLRGCSVFRRRRLRRIEERYGSPLDLRCPLLELLDGGTAGTLAVAGCFRRQILHRADLFHVEAARRHDLLAGRGVVLGLVVEELVGYRVDADRRQGFGVEARVAEHGYRDLLAGDRLLGEETPTEVLRVLEEGSDVVWARGTHDTEAGAGEVGLEEAGEAELRCDASGFHRRVGPVHRRLRHGFIFINKAAGIEKPTDLIGKRVGIKHWQVTAILWLRGILEHEYGVPHREIKWFQEMDQDVEVELPPEIDLSVLPGQASVARMLAEGELDAVIHSSMIEPMLEGDPRVGRLFPDYKAEEVKYFNKTGIFPIMHVLGIKQEIIDEHPWVATNLQRAFDASKAIAMRRMVNPRIAPLAWYMEQWEEERALLGPDPWEYGLGAQNRKTLETMIGYSHEQGLIGKKHAVDDLFVENFQGRGRGGFQV